MKKYAIMVVMLSIVIHAKMPESIEGNARRELEASFRSKSPEEVFTDIHRTNFWHGWESISGQGSNISTTRGIRAILPELLLKLGIKTLLDAPSGDFNWMNELLKECDVDLYIGIDIVKVMVKRCQQEYGSVKRVFMYGNLIDTPLPKVDMILSRDCLAHLSYADAYQVIKNFKESGSTYLLTSHHVNTKYNEDITTGLNYPIKLTIAPFNFPEPLFIIKETTEPASAHQGKCLALWRLADIDLDAIAR